ncbi:MAG: hypothetical protein K2R98_22355 [Gemmataceae bacterium]|nr:hypothetical protein [Gemmataceae bacterium]
MKFRRPFALLLVIVALPACAQETVKAPFLILDVKAESQKEPFAFRTSKNAFKLGTGTAPSRHGLDTLNASGSAEFSDESLRKILAKIPSKKVTVVDLRQESHGFVNGLSVMWWTERNTANKGKSLEQILKDEAERLAALKNADKAVIQRLVIDDETKTFDKKEAITVKLKGVQSEQEVCRANELGYLRIPVTDREAPTDVEVDRFIKFVRELPEGEWLHFHCKAGHGRTTTFMAMYDMMHNAKKVSPDDVLKRQWLLGGADLATDPPKDDWRHTGAVERRKFLEKFHQYCKANDDGFKQSWSEWLKKQK